MNRQQSSKARERRLRAKYRKNLRIAVVVSLIIGIILGCAVMNYVQKTRPVQSSRPDLNALTPSPSALALDLEPTSEVTLAPTEQPTEAPTEAPTTVPTPIPTPSPTPAPQAVVVPFGTAQTVQAQIHNDGTVRRDVDAETYETLTFSITVKRYLTPEYYQQQYSTQYQLQGDEAGVEFELMLVDYTGSQTIIPQDLLTIGLETLSGATEQGFQLTDAEIHGDNKVSVVTNVPKEIYKRFKFSQTAGDMDYMSVTGVVDGVATKYLFELGEPVRPTAAPTPSPTPARTYETLEAVTAFFNRKQAAMYDQRVQANERALRHSERFDESSRKLSHFRNADEENDVCVQGQDAFAGVAVIFQKMNDGTIRAPELADRYRGRQRTAEIQREHVGKKGLGKDGRRRQRTVVQQIDVFAVFAKSIVTERLNLDLSHTNASSLTAVRRKARSSFECNRSDLRGYTWSRRTAP